jgi:ketosteroid isomerase-like protein
MQQETQELSIARVKEIFSQLENGDGAVFFTHVADDVDWTVEGHHPLAGRYHSKVDFQAGTFEKLAKALPNGVQLHVTSVLLSGDWAVVELASLATAKNGLRFDNKYCWLTRWADEKIVEVRAYLDSAMVQWLFDENPL